ncbi:unannotated protein [freshwater metagenome]|uniref:Unannotated protein n=1 Tax=freshwater metagenome TaxID=449393 RepID=A0A6J6SGL3_9ZZZZ
MVSAGKPATAFAAYPLLVVASVTVNAPFVVLPPVPLWFSSGATTVTTTLSSCNKACTITSIPSPPIPSSFVTKICKGSATSVVVGASVTGASVAGASVSTTEGCGTFVESLLLEQATNPDNATMIPMAKVLRM